MNFKQIKNIFILTSVVLLSQTMFSVIIDENLSVFFFIILYSLLFILIQYFLIFSIIPLVLIKSKYKDLIIKFSVSGSLALMSITFVLSTSVSFLILHISYKFFYIPIIIIILIFSFFNFNKYFWKLNEKFVYLSNAEYFINDKYLKTLFGQIYPSFILSNQILRDRFKFLELIPAFLLNLIKRQICLSTIYLDGSFSSTYMKINKNYVKIYSKNFNKHGKYTKCLKRIIKRYFNLILPFGSTIIENGTDAHYGCTIPYSKNNKILTTNEYGKIKSLNNNLTIIDGSILKNLPSKPLTFTIMANAFRIGKNEYHKI
jgi:hypothetical protein